MIKLRNAFHLNIDLQAFTDDQNGRCWWNGVWESEKMAQQEPEAQAMRYVDNDIDMPI